VESPETNARERRQFSRVDREIGIEVSVAEYQQVLHTGNIGKGGIFLRAGDHPLLPVRTIVRLTPQDKKISHTVLGRVVWVSEEGMGVEYVGAVGAVEQP
jgi:hypothetical protein